MKDRGRIGLTTRVVVLAVGASAVLLFALVPWQDAAARGGWAPVWWLAVLGGLALVWALIVRWQIVRPILRLSREGAESRASGEDLPAELWALEEGMRRILQQSRVCSERERKAAEALRTFVDTLTLQMADLQKTCEDQLGCLDEGITTFETLGETLGTLSARVEGAAAQSEVLETAGGTLSGIAEQGRNLWAQIHEFATRLVERHEEAVRALDEMDEQGRSLEVSVQSAVAMVSRVSELTNHVTGHVEELERSTGDLKQVATDGERLVQDVNRHSRETAVAVQESAGILKDLGSRSQEIGAVVEVIESIADETNLLALNAAIIAAQAGEHGKSFAVVADEIRELAERTSSSTKEVADLVRGVQDGIGQAAQSIQQSAGKVQQSADLADQTGGIWDNVRSGCKKNAKLAGAIARTSSEHCRGVEQLALAVEGVARGLGAVSARARSWRGQGGRDWGGGARSLPSIVAEGASMEPKISELVERLDAQARAVGQLLVDMEGHFSRAYGVSQNMRKRFEETKASTAHQMKILGEHAGTLRSAYRGNDVPGPELREGEVLVQETSV